MKIVVLAGGLSGERDVSLSTGTMVCNALRSLGHEAILVDLFFGVDTLPQDIHKAFKSDGLLPPYQVGEEAPDLAKIKASRPDSSFGEIGRNVLALCKAADIVFLALHGAPGENGQVQAMFDMMEIKYTGCGYFASALAMDKYVSKQLMRQAGVKTPMGKLFNRAEGYDEDFPLPCIVKPRSGGSSIGITKAYSREELARAAEEAFRYEDEIIIEEFIRGREFTCGVLGNEALPPAEVIPKGDFYDYKHKYQQGMITEICPAQIPQALTDRIAKASLDTFRCLNLSVYARMDFIYDEKTDGLYCLEANTLPGLTPTSHFPQQARAAGMSYEELCQRILDLSLQKYEVRA